MKATCLSLLLVALTTPFKNYVAAATQFATDATNPR